MGNNLYRLRRNLKENRNQGRWGEIYGDAQLIISGVALTKTGIGSDRLTVRRRITGEIREIHKIDYKTGNATLSMRQKESGAKKYHVAVPPFARKIRPPY